MRIGDRSDYRNLARDIDSVNGGVWKTTNATAASPNWTQLTDTQASLSIGAIDLDPTDATRNTLLVGMGRFSSYARRGGFLSGLIRSSDGGATWTVLSSCMAGRNVRGAIERGATLLAGIDIADATAGARLAGQCSRARKRVLASGRDGAR